MRGEAGREGKSALEREGERGKGREAKREGKGGWQREGKRK